MNEPLILVTLKVILDGQAALYAQILNSIAPELNPEDLIDEYKKETAKLILEALGHGQE